MTLLTNESDHVILPPFQRKAYHNPAAACIVAAAAELNSLKFGVRLEPPLQMLELYSATEAPHNKNSFSGSENTSAEAAETIPANSETAEALYESVLSELVARYVCHRDNNP